MADLPSNSKITSTGNYDVRTIPGKEYLFCAKGTGHAVSLSYYNNTLDDFIAIDNSDLPNANSETEIRIVAPTQTLRISCSSVGSIGVFITIIPIL
jgi:hypothetical protein